MFPPAREKKLVEVSQKHLLKYVRNLSLNERKLLDEEVEALDMFKDDKDIPKESPIGSKDRNEIQNKIVELENQKNDIQSEIEKLLREQASS